MKNKDTETKCCENRKLQTFIKTENGKTILFARCLRCGWDNQKKGAK